MKRTPLARYGRDGLRMRKTPLAKVGERTKRSRRATQRFRADVLERAGHHCERCGSRDELHAHHLKSRSRGGTNDRSNGAALCFTCHRGAHNYVIPDWARWIL